MKVKMMKTPIVDFVNEYIKSQTKRLHMPGHKGYGEIEQYDITEIKGADYLHASCGIIEESENTARDLFHSKMTLYSTEGSSTVIKAMCYLAIQETKKHKILATRNAHKSFIDASILLDFEIDWIKNKEFDNICSCEIDYSDLEEKIKNNEYAAVYITSPDYLGNMLDLKRISSITSKYNTLLLQDNAHGSYLRFLDSGYHPLECNVNICADSAHKTLKCLTGGAYLHIGNNSSNSICQNAKRAISLFSSTSPSYLILQSLDLCNTYLENEKDSLSILIPKIEELKKDLTCNGYVILNSDPLKITIETKEYGYDGNCFTEILRKEKIECEYSDPDYVVLMITDLNGDNTLEYIKNVLLNISKKDKINRRRFVYHLPKKIMNTKQACMNDSYKILVQDANGMVMGYGDIICPPAISIVVPGERIDNEHIEIMKYYGYDYIYVLNN